MGTIVSRRQVIGDPARTRSVLTVMWRVGKPQTAGLFGALAFSALMFGARILAIGALVGDVPRAVRAGHVTGGAEADLGLLLLVGAVGAVCDSAGRLWGERLRFRVAAESCERLLAVCGRPEDIAHLEDPAFLDKLAVAQGAVTGFDTGAVVAGVAASWQQRCTAVVCAIALGRFVWWAPVLLGVASAVQFTYMRSLFANLFKGWIRDAAHLREADYRRNLTLVAGAAKEVRIFGLGDWLLDGFRVAWAASMARVWRQRRVMGLLGVLSFLPIAASLAVTALSVADSALRSDLTVADVVVALQAALGITYAANYDLAQVYGAHAAGALGAIDELESLALQPDSAPSGDADLGGDIEFRGVEFRYAGADRPVLAGFDLTLRAGSTVAIVGENGAGKTTLVKLLTRLCEPTAGEIRVGGTPLASVSHRAWRARTGAIFQDFARWELSLRDNVGFGDVDDAAVHAALRTAHAEEVLDRVGGDLGTLLSTGFAGGTQLSGGQWQRVALARAVAGLGPGGLLVLDEPTASLDVRAEAALFDTTIALAGGATTVLVSHRFTTVRKADRIVVLAHGRIVEDGTHEELLALEGEYATLYRLQAAQFQDAG